MLNRGKGLIQDRVRVTENTVRPIAMKPIRISFLTLLSVLSFFLPISIFAQEPQHEKIVLRGFDGSPLTIDGKAPYSPRKTCGPCHNYEQITKGYHFQQGRTDKTGKVAISDSFDTKYPWNLDRKSVV